MRNQRSSVSMPAQQKVPNPIQEASQVRGITLLRIICRSEVIVATLKRSPWFTTAWSKRDPAFPGRVL